MAKTWSHSNNNRHDPIWALYASLFLHALPILFLSSLSNLDPTIGPETRFDFIWLTPSSIPSAAPAAAIEAAEIPVPAAKRQEHVKAQELATAKLQADPAPDQDAEMAEPALAYPVLQAGRKEPRAAPAMASPEAGKDRARAAPAKPANAPHAVVQQKQLAYKDEAPHQGQQSKTAAVATVGHESPVLEKETGVGDTPVQWQQTPQIARGMEPTDQAREQSRDLEAKAMRLAEISHEQQKAIKQAARPLQERLAEPKPLAALRKPVATVPVPAPAQPTQPQPRQEVRQAPKPEQTQTAATVKAGSLAGTAQTAAPRLLPKLSAAPVAKEDAKPKSAEKPRESRGIAVASIHGDLKMVIAGDSGIRLSVAFREFPKARRHRVLTRTEARRELKIVPVFATPRPDTREAVIETAREGIYLFRVESEKGEPAKAIFTLKIFETGARGKVTAIGNRTVSNKAVLTKVLMPEGIVWDDESAFTGSLEDSDSTTKFNAQTGLYWKEYND